MVLSCILVFRLWKLTIVHSYNEVPNWNKTFSSLALGFNAAQDYLTHSQTTSIELSTTTFFFLIHAIDFLYPAFGFLIPKFINLLNFSF